MSNELQQNLVPQSDLQRSVEEILRELHATSVQLLAIGNKLRDVVSGYERMLNELRDRSSSETNEVDCASIKESDSAKQSSETIEARCEALEKKVSTLMMKRSNIFAKDSPKD